MTSAATGVTVTIDDAGGATDASPALTPTFDITVPNNAGDDAVEYNTEDQNNVDLIYAGQDFNATTLYPGREYQLRSVDETDGNQITDSTFEKPLTADSNGDITGISTSDLPTGDYFVSGDGVTATTNNTIEIIEQSFATDFDDNSVDNEGSTTVDLNVDSNRNDFDVIVESEDFDYDDSELDDIFGEDSSVTTTENSDDEFVIEGVDGDFATNFSDIDEGEYNFTFTVADTGVEDDASINVNSVGEGEADLSQSTTSVQQGDFGTFTVTMNDAAEGGDATVLIGDQDEDGYQANITVTDDDDDGEVTFAFNTYKAGNISATDEQMVSLVGDSAGEDEISFDGQSNLGDILDSGDYIVSVGTDTDPADVLDSPDNVGTLVITDRETPEQQLWRTSTDTLDDVETAAGDDDEDAAAAITTAVENDQVTQTDTLALDPDGSQDDVMVHQLTAPGLSGILGAPESGEVTTEFANALDGSNTYGDANLSVVLEEENPGANQDPATLDLSAASVSDALTVIADGQGNYYVFVDYSSVEDADYEDSDITFEDGDEVTADVSVQDTRLLNIDTSDVDADEASEDYYQTASANFSVEEAEGSFDLNEDDLVAVTVSEDAEITGTTNIAPGTEFTVRIQSSGDTEPRFFETQTVTVQADGSFNATYDLSDQSAGDEFTASVRQAGFSLSEDGVVVETLSTETPATGTATATPDEGTATATATPDEGTATATATATATEADDGTPTEETSTSTPGFGAVLAVIALMGAALLAARRNN
ncbi:BGTF surface domain-containing protein [Halobaculum rarum]|uniref:BGTF surface domain-containing protein n=1 Tax=Halobaculum rarum TaxID=3075122 RepID=UPI0032AFDE0A